MKRTYPGFSCSRPIRTFAAPSFRRTLAAISLLSASAAFAQVGSSTITGTVQDTTGAAIPGATIVLRDVANQTSRTLKSNGTGFFSFVNIAATTYQVTVSSPGFNTVVRNNIQVHIDDQLNLSGLKLAIATSDTTVTVTTEDQIVPLTSGEQSYTLTAKQIDKLNIEGRSAIELLGLVPGAANAGNFNSNAYAAPVAGFTQNTSAFSVNGNRFDQVQIISDGAPVTDVQTAGASAVTPNVDMIQESKIQTAAYSSDQPNGPIVVQTETKAGGKNFHGEVYLTARNHALDTTDWRVKYLGLAKPNDSFLYPGGNIGGPVILPGTGFNRNRDKLFFFFGFEKSIQNVQDPLIDIREAIVPTAANRNGDFSDSAYLAKLGALSYFAGVTPCTGNSATSPECKGAANGIISPTQIDPGGKILLNLLPLPNANPGTTGGYNYISSFLKSQPRDQETTRIDYNFNARNHLSARYNHEGENVPYPYGLYNNFTLTPYPASESSADHSHSITTRLSSSIGAAFTNEATFTYTRLTLGTVISNLSNVSRTALNYPYPNLYTTGSDIVPNVSFQAPSLGSIYIAGGDAPPYATNQLTIVAGDQVARTFRTHLVRAGVYYERDTFNKRTQGNDNGSVTASYYNFTTGNQFADLLTGAINSYSQSSANFMAEMLLHRTDFFLEDLWQAKPRLTVNYGVRIDHIGRWYDQNGRNTIFDPALYNPAGAVGNSSGFTNHMVNPTVSLSGSLAPGFKIAPSGGFAYDFLGTGKTILRGGVGLNYYSDPGQNAYSSVQAPPNEQFTTIYPNGGTMLSQVSKLSAAGLYPTAYGIAYQHDAGLPGTLSYNLAVAQELPARINLQLAYTGNGSRDLSGYLAQNLVPEGCELPGGPGVAVGYAPGTYNDQLCRPYKNVQALSTIVHNQSSYFNSLQVAASRQTGILNFTLSYTYGKTLAYNCEDPFNQRRCYNPAPFDQTHAVNITYLVTLPSPGKKYLGDHKLINGLTDGWQISGIESFASGSPIQFSANPGGNEYDGIHNRTINFYGVSDQKNSYNSPNFDSRLILGTPDEAAVPTVVCDPTANLKKGQFFNPSCFRAPQLGVSSSQPSIGSYHLPYIHGPHFQNDEIGLFKDFRIKEGSRVEFRAQGFNYLNHPVPTFIQYDPALYLQFDAYGGAPVNAAGTPSQKLGARIIQLSAKYYF